MQFQYTCNLLDVKPLFARDLANQLNGVLAAIGQWPDEKRGAALEALIVFGLFNGITLEPKDKTSCSNFSPSWELSS